MQHQHNTPNRQPTGRRNIPNALIMALSLEQKSGPLPKVKKGHLLLALKQARNALGVSKSVIETVTTLISLVDAKVFETGSRPIIGPSNTFLAYEAGVCVRAIQARISGAIAAGLLIPLDAPDGKRWARRHGTDAEEYGFDLSPIVRRFAELEAHRGAFLEDYREAQRIRRRISTTRNQCLAMLDALAMAGDESALDEAAEVQQIAGQRRKDYMAPAMLGPILLALEAKKAALVDKLAELDKSAENKSFPPVNSSPVGESNFTQQRTTKRNQISKEITGEACKNASVKVSPDHVEEPSKDEGHRLDAKKGPITGAFPLTPALACKIAPAFQAFVIAPTWSNLIDAAPKVAESLDVARWSWGKACQNLGRLGALAVLVAVAGRHQRGGVASPGGLFTRMVELANDGALNLDKTFYGLIGKSTETTQ